MKMIKSVLLSIIILLCITAGLDMYVYAVTDGYFEYSFYDENSIEITAYNGNATNLSIPKEIDGYAVKSIGDYAFESCTGLNSVTIPSSVEFINWYAFDNCTGLKTLVISEGVKEICEGAFNGCSSLTNVIIPNSVTLIDIGAFADCSALKSINIPQNVEIIEPYAFRNCSSLSAITVDENNEYYDSRNNCNAIIETDTDILIFGCKNTIIPNTVLEIGEGAFCGCVQLESISIPNSVIAIGDYAFEGCSAMKSVIISENTVTIGTSAFDWCTGLVGVTIPISVEIIDSSAFDHCNSMEYIAIFNEDCYIDYDKYTISDTACIYGYKDSSAQDYAEDYNRAFMPLEEVIAALNMPAVKNIKVSNITTTGATVTYDAVAGASGYIIQQLQNGNWINLTTVTKATATLNKLQSGTNYSIRVCSYKTINGKKFYSNNISVICSFKTLSEYTVVYDANGGTGAPAAQTKIEGVGLVLSSIEPIREGYTFLGWSRNKYATVAGLPAGGTYGYNESTTLYAVWAKNTYTVEYDANGGTGAPATQIKTHGVGLVLSSVEPTREGYTFLGWSRNKYATVPGLPAGGTYGYNESTTLYAVWEITTYTVVYDANGGTGAPEAQIKTHGVGLVLSSVKPTREGYAFLGWSRNKYATVAGLPAGGTYGYDESTILYAVWANKFLVTYDANGGTGAPEAQTKDYGVGLKLSTVIPTREGYAFLGWSRNKYATVPGLPAGGTYGYDESTTLYAVWANKFLVTYDANGGTGAPEAQTKDYGVGLKLSTIIPTREGYTFLGWSRNKYATVAGLPAGGTYGYDESTTLYAVWKANT